MSEKLKTIKEKLNNLGLYKICVLLITAAIVAIAVFYCWDVWEKQAYFEKEKEKRPSFEEWKSRHR